LEYHHIVVGMPRRLSVLQDSTVTCNVHQDTNILMMGGCTNPRCHVTWVTKFCIVAPNTCGSLGWNLLPITLLAPRMLRLLLDVWKVCAPMLMVQCSWGVYNLWVRSSRIQTAK